MAAFCGLLVATSISPNQLRAQASAGPLAPPAQSQAPPSQSTAKPKEPEIQPRTSLEGAWKLNRDESDDPRTTAQDSRSTNGGNGGGYPGGGYPGGGGRYPGGGGYPGGGYPGGGYPGGGRGPRGGQDDGGRNTDSDEKIQELIRPAGSLSFVLKNAEVDVTDDRYRRLVFYTDGRQLKKSANDNDQEIAARWNGSQLVSDEKSPQGGKMSRTFELSRDGRQVYETLSIDRSKSRGPLAVRYVYEIANPKNAQTSHDSDPDQPVYRKRADDNNSSPH
jgi:hypothetical protein